MEGEFQRRSLREVLMGILKFTVIVGLIVAVGFFFKFLYDIYMEDRRTIPTAENNKAIAAAQVAKYDQLYLSRNTGGTEGFQNPSDGRSGNIPLINYNVLGCRMAGYVGPVFSGIFDEDNAVRIALRAGCRAFCLNIGMLEKAASPVLLVRSKNGDLISNNIGSIRKVCQSLANNAPSNQPIILFLYFEKLPNKNPYDLSSMKFMMDVALGLAPLRRRHLGLTDAGDFRRQKMQDTLFLNNRSAFDGKFIILTNVDTTGFREGAIPSTNELPRITPDNDLDLWTHARVFTYTTTSLGATSTPGESKGSGPRVETPAYFSGISEENTPDIAKNSMVNWTIAMNSSIDAAPHTPAQLKDLLDVKGVSCVMADVFQDGLFDEKRLLSKDYFGPSGWRIKPQALRYTRPADIPISKPSQDLNAVAGIMTTRPNAA
jgi:hypothetical protein